MYKSVVVIGSGSLGSFITISVSQLDQIEKIVLIDHDIVLKKNLRNTIYKKKDIGRLKVDALKDIIETNNEVEVIKINEKFIENNIDLSDYDLVLDCRDFTYNRNNIIHSRLYISSRYLIVDCRKNIKYEKQYKGKYLSRLTKTDLRNTGITHLGKLETISGCLYLYNTKITSIKNLKEVGGVYI